MAANLSAEAALTRHFNEARSRLLDLAAILDRIERGEGAAGVRKDSRLVKTREAIAALLAEGVDRAERVQMIFSRPYEAGWQARG